MTLGLARPELVGSFGMVASTHWLASQCGMSVLERGGNAFDAAVAAGLVLQVVEPHLNGPGGEVPIMGWDSRAATAFTVCGQGPAPRAATIAAYRDRGLEHVPGTGFLAACVPGAFGAWMRLLRDYGTWSLRDVIAYAIHYANVGFPVLPKIREALASVQDFFSQHWPTSQQQWLPNNALPSAGSIMRNLELARTYTWLVDEAETTGVSRETEIDAAVKIFYEGFVAEEIERFSSSFEAMDSSGQRHSGLITGQDLASWQATIETPLSYSYGGYEVYKPGPWSQGPVLLQQLALLDGFDVRECRPTGPEFVHLVTESAKLAFADREFFYGDPDFVDVGMETLLSEEYNSPRRRLIDHGKAHIGDLRPGLVDGIASPGMLPSAAQTVHARRQVPGIGEPTLKSEDGSRGDTCHVDIADRWGNMVSATPSGGWFQSSPTVPGLGFALGSRAQMFWLDESHPNGLKPGKRPRTTLSATILVKDQQARLAFGTPGGDTQDQCSLQFLLRHLVFDMNLQEAIESPAFFSEDFPSSFYPRDRQRGRLVLEGRFDTATVQTLEELGHDVMLVDGWTIGRLSAVSLDESGVMRAAANPRGAQGYAVGR